MYYETRNTPEFTPDVSSLALEFTLGVCLLACLPGVGGLLQKEAKYRSRSKAEIRRLLAESGRLLAN